MFIYNMHIPTGYYSRGVKSLITQIIFHFIHNFVATIISFVFVCIEFSCNMGMIMAVVEDRKIVKINLLITDKFIYVTPRPRAIKTIRMRWCHFWGGKQHNLSTKNWCFKVPIFIIN